MAYNTAGVSSGGGIFNYISMLTLTNSTVAYNTAGVLGNGGGIYDINGSTTLQNTILALNTASNASLPSDDCFGVVTSLGTNLIGDSQGCTIMRPQGGSDLTGDPGLDTFTDDGTPGNGHFPLLETSQAIDAGDDDICPDTDQLGQPRVGQHCDIGAIEFPTQLVVGATWVPVPGNGFTPSAPAATVFQDNLALFVQGTDDRIYVNWLLPHNQWTGRSAVPGNGFTPSAPAATVFQGNLALFVQGTDDRIYVNWLLPHNQWTGWSAVPGRGSTPSAPAATVFQDNLALFVQGTDDRIYVNWLLPHNQWTGWSAVPGNGFTPSAPAATVFQGDLALFVQGTDDRIYVNWLLPHNQWTGWSAVPGAGLRLQPPPPPSSKTTSRSSCRERMTAST